MKLKVISAAERQRRIETVIKREPWLFSLKNRRGLEKNMRRLEKIDEFMSGRVMSMSLYLIADVLKRFFASRALFHAATLGKVRLAEQLISQYGADVNYRGGKIGNTPLHQAVLSKRLGMAEFLLKKGAKIKPNKYGDTAPLLACVWGVSHAIPMFHGYDVDFNKPDIIWSLKKTICGWGYVKHYPIAMAFICRHPETLQRLIDTGVNLNIPVLHTSPFQRNKTLLQEIDNPTPGNRPFHPEAVKIVRQIVTGQYSKKTGQVSSAQQEHTHL